jgi:hypothetical protein
MKMYNTRLSAKIALFITVILAVSFNSNAQFCTSCLTNFRAYNNTNITIKTGPKSITPVNVGGNIDSLARYIGDVAATSGVAPTLQGVLNNGNIAADDAGNAIFGLWNISGTPTKSNSMSYEGISINQSSANIIGINNISGSPVVNVGNTSSGHTLINLNSGVAELSLKNGGTESVRLNGSSNGSVTMRDGTSGNFVTFHGNPVSGSLSASRNLYPPNQTGTILVEASVNRPSSVTNSTFGNKIENAGWYTQGTYTSGTYLGQLFFNLWEAGGVGRLSLYEAATNFSVNLNPATGLTANRSFTLPNHSGALVVNNGGSITGGTVVSDSIVVTHGLGFTPNRIFYTARNADAAQPHYIKNITSTTFTVTYVPASVNPLDFDWQAF